MEDLSLFPSLDPLTTGLVAGSIGLMYYVFRKPTFQYGTVPGWFPIIGHMHLTNGMEQLPIDIERWCDEYGENGIFHVDLAGQRFHIICSEHTLEEVMKHRGPGKIERPVGINESVNSLGAPGIFSATGDVWVKERKYVSQALNHANVRDYFSIFQDFSRKLISQWKEKASSSISIESDLTYLTADVVAKVTMDQDFRLMEESSSKTARDVRKIMDTITTRSISPFYYWRIPFIGQYLDGAGGSIRRIHGIISQAVKKPPSEKKTYLQKIQKALESEKTHLSEDRLIGNVATVFLGGTDTTASALLFALYHLGCNKDLQDRLRQEVDTVSLDELSPTTDFAVSMPRIKSLMHEVHRHSSLPVVFHQTFVDVPCAGKMIPAKSLVATMNHYISTNTKNPSSSVPFGPNGEHPSEFCPDRYLVGRTCPDPETKLGAFGAFGYGVRKCPGRKYTEVFSFLVLARLLQSFTWELEGTPTEKRKFTVALLPDMEVRILLSERR